MLSVAIMQGLSLHVMLGTCLSLIRDTQESHYSLHAPVKSNPTNRNIEKNLINQFLFSHKCRDIPAVYSMKRWRGQSEAKGWRGIARLDLTYVICPVPSTLASAGLSIIPV